MADVLSPLTTKVRRHPFITLDIESKNGPSQKPGFTRPFLVGVYTPPSKNKQSVKDCYHFFRNQRQGGSWKKRAFLPGGCIDRAMRFILRDEFRSHYIYAHNGGKFDFLHLLPWFRHVGSKLGYKWKIIPVCSSILAMQVWVGDRKWGNGWLFLDSMRLIPKGLNKACEAFGVPGKVDHDLGRHENDPEWITYLAGDIKSLYLVLEQFHNLVEHSLRGEVGITAASTAMRTYRRGYLKQDIQRNESTHDFIRESYCGGRSEVFQHKAENLRYYDFHSSYPACMLEKMPTGKATLHHGSPTRAQRENQVGFCRVDVQVPPELIIPPLPLKHQGKLIFPAGHLRGIWEYDELALALEMGCTVTRWHESIWYESSRIFEDYVQTFWQYRDKKRPGYNEGLSTTAKLLLNSTYGKFATKVERTSMYCVDDPDLPENAAPLNGNDEKDYVWVATEETNADYIIPQISARITALARVRLYRAMQRVNFKVAYCDTDSILTPEYVPDSDELGELKDELPEHSGKLSGLFLAPKAYAISHDDFQQTRIKGVAPRDYGGGKKARELYLKRAFYVLRMGGELRMKAKQEDRLPTPGKRERGVVYMKRFEKVGTMARKGFELGPQLVVVPRRMLTTNDKREVLADGINTKPKVLNMWT